MPHIVVAPYGQPLVFAFVTVGITTFAASIIASVNPTKTAMIPANPFISITKLKLK